MTENAMDQLTEKRTGFVIAHRLSTIKNNGGFYAELYNSRFDWAA